MKKNWVIKVNGKYVTRTHFRYFGGRIVLSEDLLKAKVFTRKTDADKRARVVTHRLNGAREDYHPKERELFLAGAKIEVVHFGKELFTT